VRARALIRVAGPRGAGKTTFIERVLEGAGEWILAARCVRDDSLRALRETAPKAHPELRRYRKAGATGAAFLTFPERDVGSEAFFVTRLMEDCSKAVLLEGDKLLEFVDLAVFVAAPPSAGGSLLVRRKRDRAKEERAKADAMERLLREPDGVAVLLDRMIGAPMADIARKHPGLLEETRDKMLAGIALARKAPAPAPTEHWAIAGGYEGIERAQLVVINVRSAAQRERGESLLAGVHRIRRDRAVFDDVLGFRGTKIPITAVVADLADGNDAGTKKALARVRRVLLRALS
jgi:molybdopterin-guanine dinucleotide biosynthesis protein